MNGPTVYDYATAIDEDTRQRWVARHRLEKRNPGPGPSRARRAHRLLRGSGHARACSQRVDRRGELVERGLRGRRLHRRLSGEVLPEGVDPQDIRYNMIHWTHRRTRGYSYGNTVADPRTGEIVRGVVNLGSLRLRQDYLHGQGMVAPFPGGISSADGWRVLPFRWAPGQRRRLLRGGRIGGSAELRVPGSGGGRIGGGRDGAGAGSSALGS